MKGILVKYGPESGPTNGQNKRMAKRVRIYDILFGIGVKNFRKKGRNDFLRLYYGTLPVHNVLRPGSSSKIHFEPV